MATQTKTGAAGFAAALPVSSLAIELDALHDLADSTHDAVVCQVTPLLRAAENLADCRRTLDLLTSRAQHDPAFAAQVRSIDPAYLNHTSEYDGFALIQDLLRVAVNLLADNASRLERIGPTALALKGRYCELPDRR